MKKQLISICLLAAFFACKNRDTQAPAAEQAFVKIENGRMTVDGKPYVFIGTNFWFGPLLGSVGQGGDRARLAQELTFMQSLGINNLRILVGADGPSGQAVKIRPTLQPEPGVYNDTIFDGLDYLLSELGKRRMYAVLYLNNSWEWSGGYGQYLHWAGRGEVPEAGVRDWEAFQRHVAQYATCGECKELFFNHVKHVLGRTNRYTGRRYTDDPAILSWQVGNEPRAFSGDAKAPFAEWVAEAAHLIRSLDRNHLVSIGNEGAMGCENDLSLYEKIHADPNVDYLTLHIWPKNWSWIDTADVRGSVAAAIAATGTYIQTHLDVAARLNKPLVIEEFGFPRDHHLYSPDDPTTARDQYYEYIFRQVISSAEAQGFLSGCNFWAWGGSARPVHTYWQPWDDYVGDPAQEEQGLNAVFDTDATVGLIARTLKNTVFIVQ